MLLAEEVVLLAVDDRTGTLRTGSERLDAATAGGLVAELALLGRLELTVSAGLLQRPRVQVRPGPLVHDATLDKAEATLRLRGPVHPARLLRRGRSPLLSASRGWVLERLVDRGVLRAERARLLGVLPRATWPTHDPEPEQELRRRLHDQLVVGLTPDPRTAALVQVLHAAKLLATVLPDADPGALRARAATLGGPAWVGEAVRRANAFAAVRALDLLGRLP